MNPHVQDLLRRMVWPGIDAITYGDGTMTLLDIDFLGDRRYVISPIADSSVESYMKYNAGNLSHFDVTAKVEYGDHDVCVGDGSDESNGVVYVTNKRSRELSWFAFFERSDPFLSVSVDDRFVTAVTSAGVRFKIRSDNPLDIQLIYPDGST